jgi:lipoprotein-anchoring transpeptidase ErfK/SrfK
VDPPRPGAAALGHPRGRGRPIIANGTAAARRPPRGSWPVGIGQDNTPTPTGQFYITVKLSPPQISHVYGAWALGLSAYSDVLEQFGTGDGQIALHGTADLGDLGQQVSNGCIRMANQVITHLAETLPLGTPVTIRE